MVKRVKIKICGITRIEDALYAADLGADALGFIFYKKSPRYISQEKVQRIIRELPPFVTTIGLFVNETEQVINDIITSCNINMVQLHGNEAPSICCKIERPVIKAFSVKTNEDLKRFYAYKDTSAWLLDGSLKGKYGGTGTRFDWTLVNHIKRDKPIILAGGLTSTNVLDAISIAGPYAVDVSSGIELSPGIKDKIMVKEFIQTIKGKGY